MRGSDYRTLKHTPLRSPCTSCWSCKKVTPLAASLSYRVVTVNKSVGRVVERKGIQVLTDPHWAAIPHTCRCFRLSSIPKPLPIWCRPSSHPIMAGCSGDRGPSTSQLPYRTSTRQGQPIDYVTGLQHRQQPTLRVRAGSSFKYTLKTLTATSWSRYFPFHTSANPPRYNATSVGS